MNEDLLKLKSTYAYNGMDYLEILADAKNYNQFLLSNVIKHSKNKNHVLDFGAGNGYFSERVRLENKNVSCVELDETLASLLRRNGFSTSPSLDKVANGSVDFIYSLNVLEHIENDQLIIEQMYECLKPGGRVYIYVPAFNVLYSSMDKRVGHFRRYRIERVRKLISGTSFKLLYWSYCDSIGFFVSLVFRFIGNKEGSVDSKMIYIYDRFLFPLNKVLDLFFKRVAGKNLHFVLEK